MQIISEEEIWKRFWKKYNREPKGWRIFSGLSEKGHPELRIVGKKETFLIKRESLYSGKLGIGGRISESIDEVRNKEQFGFREIPDRTIETLLSVTKDEVDTKKVNTIFGNILAQQPALSLEKIRSPIALQGPIVHSPRPLDLLSNEQMRLDGKIELELERWKRRIYHIQ
jgi:hypothetical protein